ncbi:MAG: hypothetical protein IJ088_03770 [Clostridia bacterium]|nr:hypothetical protein [Clostridia bacterium]
MTFQEFTDLLVFFLTRDFGYDGDRLRSLPRGYVPTGRFESDLIRDTNQRYFSRESNELLGNFMFVNYPREAAGAEPNWPIRNFERLPLDTLYECSERGGFETVLAWLRQARCDARLAENSEAMNHPEDYQLTKDSLIICPINYNAHHRALRYCTYRRVGDIALVLCALFAHEKGRYLTGRIPRKTLELWGVKDDAAIDAALENTEHKYPATLSKHVRMRGRKTVISTYRSMGPLRELTEDISDARVVSLSGRDNPNGAVSLFFPGVADLLYEKIGGAFYAILIAPHCAVIHSANQTNVRKLLGSLKENNAINNWPEDVLSTHVFRFDGHRLEIVRR